MSTFYKVAYEVGFTPWEALLDHRPFASALLDLVAREESGPAPFGRALDLGTGSGTWAVELAKRGWDVTGVDMVPKALRRAEERAAAAGVHVRFLRGDVTRLEESQIGSRYRLLLDTGTFHGLGEVDQRAMGRSVTAVAGPEATLIIDAFAPGHRGPLPRGCTREAIESAFPGWEISDVVVADTEPDVLARALHFDELFYRLVRRA
jgi:SAM-dependent methyltransferase